MSEFKITEPGCDGDQVEVLVRNPHNERYPWVVTKMNGGGVYSVSDYGVYGMGNDHLNIVARCEEPKPKFERVAMFRASGGTLDSVRTYQGCCLSTSVASFPGFAGYIYEHDGQKIISSLPCGWLCHVMDDDQGTPVYAISAANEDDDPPIFPVAWRRLREANKEGGE